MTISRTFLVASVAVVGLSSASASKADEKMYLSLGSRTPAARIIASSGLGTADAQATGRVRVEEAREVCEGFIIGSPRKIRDCARGLMADHAGPVHASADCMAGVLRDTSGDVLRYAGEWSKEDAYGSERSKWRGSDGKVLGNFMASGAATASAQWAALCGPNAKPGHPTFADEMRARVARRSNGTPREAFKDLISFDRLGGWNALFAPESNPAMKRLLSAELAKNWVLATSHGEPVFDASPFTGKQNDGFSTYSITKISEADDSTSAQIEAVLDTSQAVGIQRHKQLYMFVNEDNRWKLNEINYDLEHGPRFLHSYLRDYLRRVAEQPIKKTARSR
ncbi:hypothetical protein ACFZ8E_02565 [Methylobacterium sp. HMF5984]|uniref:hypothetical protein n=1 Tax=Methylobacterium sp. HMF5984 TaxID=3367370 RepID=UPI003852A9E1